MTKRLIPPNMKKIIRDLYYDPILGFNSQRVYEEAKKRYGKDVTHTIVDAVINKQQLPQRFAKPSYSYRRHFLVREPNVQWQMDTLFINLKVKKLPKGLTWAQRAGKLDKIIVCVDVFTKKVMMRKVRSNTGQLTTAALRSMVKEAGTTPLSIYVDKGSEFNNRYFKRYCRDNDIDLIFAVKLAPTVERMNRSIKELAEKFKKAYKSNLADYLDDISKNINNRVSRPIKKTPIDAENEFLMEDEEGVQETFDNLRKYLGDNTDAKDIRVGDKVRVLKFTKSALKKRYVTQWTKSSFTVLKHSMNGIYTLDKHYGPRKYNANYLKKVTGTVPPPPKRIKPGGVEWRLMKAQEAKKTKTGYDPPQPRGKSKRVRKRRQRLEPNQSVNVPQKFNLNTKIRKKFGGKFYQGKVTKYNSKNGFYTVVYEDGDKETMDTQEVRRYRMK